MPNKKPVVAGSGPGLDEEESTLFEFLMCVLTA
jgi:hypothetical protein